MQQGSLIMLIKSPDPRDYIMAASLGVDLPKRDLIYTVSRGPSLEFNKGSGKSVLAVEIDELPGGKYDVSFFVEIQKPMKVDLNEILYKI